MTLVEMAKTQAHCAKEAHTIITQAEAAGRELTAEELDAVDSLLARAEELDARSKTLARFEGQQERLTGINHRLDAPAVARTLTQIGQGYGQHATRRYGVVDVDPRSYVGLFGTPQRSAWEDNGREFYRALQSERFDARLIQAAAMGEAQGSAGGFLVPEERAAYLLDQALRMEIVRPRADVTGMTSQTKIVAGFDGRDQSAGLYGFTFQWLQENQTVTPGTGKVRAIQLTAHAGGIYLSASNELVQDAIDFERTLESRIIMAIAESMDFYYLTGTGAGMPLGVLRASARLIVPKVGGQAADTVLAANIYSMFAASSNPTGAVWVTSPTALPQLLALTVNATSPAPMVSQGTDGSLTLLTRPLLVSSKMPTIGEEGDVLFADFAALHIGIRKEVSLEKSRDAGFAANQTWYRAIVRTDSQPKIDQPFIGRDGEEYSPFVVLQAR